MSATSLNKTFNEVKSVITVGNGTGSPTDKTLVNTDSGKLIFIDHNNASALTVTLPAVEAGLHFKFLFITKLAANGTFVVASPSGSNTLRGTII